MLLPIMSMAVMVAAVVTSNNINALNHTHDVGLFDHTNELMRVIFPLLGAIAGLVVWAFRRLEKADDKVIDTLEKCAAENDKINDELFKLMREHESKLSELHEFMRAVRLSHKHQHNEDL